MLNAIKDTTKHVYWDSHERVYIALMSETPTCRAEGSTPAEAIQNVDRAYARYEVRDEGPTWPAPLAKASRSTVAV